MEHAIAIAEVAWTDRSSAKFDWFKDDTSSSTKLARQTKFFDRIATMQIPSHLIDEMGVMAMQQRVFEVRARQANTQNAQEQSIRRYVTELWLSELNPDLSEDDAATLLTFVPDQEEKFKSHVSELMFADDTQAKWWSIALNLFRTCKSVFEGSSLGAPLDRGVLQALNGELMNDLIDDNGVIRQLQASPLGFNVTYAQPKEIRLLLDNLCNGTEALMKEIQREPDAGTKLFRALTVASIFFSHLMWIHPFSDGNGRTARVALSLLLMPFTAVPISLFLTSDSRDWYLKALFEHHTSLEAFPSQVLNVVWNCTAATFRSRMTPPLLTL